MDPIKWPQPKVVKSPLVEPSLGNLERIALNQVFDSGQIGSISPNISKVEKEFGKALGLNCQLVANGSVALMLGLRALGLKMGDKVLTSTLTYAATASSIVNIGAIPVFCDVELDSWQISIDSIKRMYTNECKAIVVPHVYGVSADMEPIKDFAEKKGLVIVEDCAESLFGEYRGYKLGTLGEVSTFSFFPNKLITSGEGGMVSTGNLKLHEKMKRLKGQGMDPEHRYWFLEPGYNFRITGLQASILGSQLQRLEELWKFREDSESIYRSMLGDFMVWPTTKYEIRRSPWIFSACLVSGGLNNKLLIAHDLARQGIETRPIFYPLHKMPAFEKYLSDICDNSVKIADSGISLPTGRHVNIDTYNLIQSSVHKHS